MILPSNLQYLTKEALITLLRDAVEEAKKLEVRALAAESVARNLRVWWTRAELREAYAQIDSWSTKLSERKRLVERAEQVNRGEAEE